ALRPQILGQLREHDALRRYIGTSGEDGWTELELLGNVYQEGGRRVVQLNLRDVSPRRLAADAPRGMDDFTRELQNVEASGWVAATVSHELGNQLTTILMYCDLLRGRKQSQMDTADLQEILAAAERASALDKRLLALGRKQQRKPQVINLNRFVEEMDQMISIILGDRYKVVRNLASDVAPVRADAVRLEEAVLHVLLNARRSMPEGGELRIETGNME